MRSYHELPFTMYEFGNSYFWISFVLSRRSWCLCTRCRGLCVQRASRCPGSGAPWGILRGWAAPVWSRVFGSINAQPSQQSPDANEMYTIGLHESSAKWESREKCATKRQLLLKFAAGLCKTYWVGLTSDWVRHAPHVICSTESQRG